MRQTTLVIALATMLLLLTASSHATHSGPEHKPFNFVFIMTDDHTAGGVGTYRGDDGGTAIDTRATTNEQHATPNMNAIATAGFRADYMMTQSQCSPSRVQLFGFGRPGRFTNNIGSNVTQRMASVASAGGLRMQEWKINPYSNHLIRQINASGTRTGYYGKMHVLPPSEVGAETTCSKLGFDYCDAIANGGASGAGTFEDTEGVGDHALGIDHNHDCLSHNYWVKGDKAGNHEIETDYTTEVMFDAALARIASDPGVSGDELFVFISPTAPHLPASPPVGSADCNTDTDYPGDLPPIVTSSSTVMDITGDHVEYLDTKIQEVRDALDPDTDILCVMGDNGEPGHIAGLVQASAECQLSKGQKRTPYPCGTRTFLVCEGMGIPTSRKEMTTLVDLSDLSKTIRELVTRTKGGHPDGQSFADCMTESNGKTAATCDLGPTKTAQRYAPGGGNSNTIARPPDFPTDGWEEFSAHDLAVYYRANGEYFLLTRIYDIDEETSPLPWSDRFFDLNATTAPNPPGNFYALNVGGVRADALLVTSGGLVAGDFSGPGITANEQTALTLMQYEMDRMVRKDYTNAPPSFSGASF